MSAVSENVKSEKQWLRGLFALLFIIILEITKVVGVTVAILQFLFAILTGKGNSNLTQFGSSLAQYFQQILDFLTYNSDDKPFPFAQWPDPVVAEEQAEMEFDSGSTEDVETPVEDAVADEGEQTAGKSAEQAPDDSPEVEDKDKEEVENEVENEVEEKVQDKADGDEGSGASKKSGL